METVATRYAESLFDLAKEENRIEQYEKDMTLVSNVFDTEGLVQFFSHVSVKDGDKYDILNKSFKDQVNVYVLNFLMLLVKKRRIKYIKDICKEFQSLCNEHFGIVVGKVFTAFELSENQLNKIEEAISQKIGKKTKLHMVIDSTLIGGIRVEVNNHVYDDSLSYKLESLRKELLRK